MLVSRKEEGYAIFVNDRWMFGVAGWENRVVHRDAFVSGRRVSRWPL